MDVNLETTVFCGEATERCLGRIVAPIRASRNRREQEEMLV
jgi:hypothetical protein